MKKTWIFFLLLVPFYLTWTFDHSLWNPDETRDAGIAAEMARSGHYAVPTLNGEPFLEKPPLYYWACSLVYGITGHVTAGTTRLPAALFGLLGIFFTFLIGKEFLNENVGLMAAAMLATSFQYFRMSHFAMMDIALATLVTGALYFYLRESHWGFALCTVGAFYAKGFLGVLLPSLVVTTDLWMQKKIRHWFRIVVAGSVVFACVVLPWFWLLWKQGGMKYLHVFIIENHWDRFFSAHADHTEHFWFFYFLSFPVDFLPWTICFLGFLWDLIRQSGRNGGPNQKLFPLVWFFSLLAFFCLSSSKRSIYLLPLFPAAALLSAHWLDQRFGEKSHRWVFRLAGGLAILIGLGSFVLAQKLDQKKTFVPFTDVIEQNWTPDTAIVGFDLNEMERGVFGFYLRQTFHNVRSVDGLRQLLVSLDQKPYMVIVNRNRMEDVQPALADNANLIFQYRPDKRTRSYLLYKNETAEAKL